jgi:hypothetical protein
MVEGRPGYNHRTQHSSSEGSKTVETYVQELSESRQYQGDGLVVSIGDVEGRADVFWSNPASHWVVIDWRSEKPKVARLHEIALVQFNSDVDVSLYDLGEMAFAFDTAEGDSSVYILPVNHLDALASYGSEFSVVWRSDRL